MLTWPVWDAVLEAARGASAGCIEVGWSWVAAAIGVRRDGDKATRGAMSEAEKSHFMPEGDPSEGKEELSFEGVEYRFLDTK